MRGGSEGVAAWARRVKPGWDALGAAAVGTAASRGPKAVSAAWVRIKSGRAAGGRRAAAERGRGHQARTEEGVAPDAEGEQPPSVPGVRAQTGVVMAQQVLGPAPESAAPKAGHQPRADEVAAQWARGGGLRRQQQAQGETASAAAQPVQALVAVRVRVWAKLDGRQLPRAEPEQQREGQRAERSQRLLPGVQRELFQAHASRQARREAA